MAIVGVDSFYRPDHGRLFGLFVRMRRAGKPIDRLTVSEAVLADKAGDEAFGGYGYVVSMTEHCPSTTNVAHYARTVAHHHRARTLLRGLDDVRALVADDLDAAVVKLRDTVARADATSSDDGSDLVHIAVAAREALQASDDVARGKGHTHGPPMPLRSLAAIVPVLPVGEVTLIAARPGMGKSALARCIAEGVALSCPDDPDARRPAVLVLSFEMDATQVAGLSVASLGDVSASDLRAGRLDQAAWDRAEDAAREMEGMPMWLYRGPGLTVEGVRAKVRAAKRKAWNDGHELRLVVVDYVQIMRPTAGKDSDANVRIGHISWGLKDLAVSERVAVLALSQLNRAIEKRSDRTPQLSDIRDSGSLEQDAACIMFPVRPSENGDPSASEDEAVVYVRKWRYGPQGEALLRWVGSRTRFEDRDDRNTFSVV